MLHNLKRSGLDRAILGFVHKPEFVLGGYSAGAMIMSPSIEICRYGNIDENRVSLAEFSALGLFDFEVFPHYEEENEQAILAYEYSIHGKVLRIPNEEIFFIDMKNESKASIDKVKRFE